MARRVIARNLMARTDLIILMQLKPRDSAGCTKYGRIPREFRVTTFFLLTFFSSRRPNAAIRMCLSVESQCPACVKNAVARKKSSIMQTRSINRQRGESEKTEKKKKINK